VEQRRTLRSAALALDRPGVHEADVCLTAAITEWAEHWNTDPKPFVWKATAEQIITKSDADVKVRRGRETLHRIKAQTDH
jgi:hypothetical protein